MVPPKRIPLKDGTARLLPVLVIGAAHSRFITGGMVPTRRTDDWTARLTDAHCADRLAPELAKLCRYELITFGI